MCLKKLFLELKNDLFLKQTNHFNEEFFYLNSSFFTTEHIFFVTWTKIIQVSTCLCPS